MLDILRRPARERFGLILTELGDRPHRARRGRPDDAAPRRPGAARDRQGPEHPRRQPAHAQPAHARRRHRARRPRPQPPRRRALRPRGRPTRPRPPRAAPTELSQTVDKLPRFLRELRPTLADLGTTARLQTPALRDLRRAAPDLTELLKRLGPFAESARPAVRGLGEASQTGITAVKEARSTVRQLRALGAASTEPMRNLRFVLEDVNDRGRAVEPNRLSPTGAGFTGLEALLQYFFVQSQAINIYDSKGYLLKLNILLNECSQYTNAQTARRGSRAHAQLPVVARPQPARGDDGRGRAHDAEASPSARRDGRADKPADGAAPRRPPPAGPAATAATAAAPAAVAAARSPRSCSTSSCRTCPICRPLLPRSSSAPSSADERAQPPRLPPGAVMRGRRPPSVASNPVFVGRGHGARRRRRGAARLPGQPGPAVRADVRAEGRHARRRAARRRQRGPRGRLPRRSGDEDRARAGRSRRAADAEARQGRRADPRRHDGPHPPALGAGTEVRRPAARHVGHARCRRARSSRRARTPSAPSSTTSSRSSTSARARTSIATSTTSAPPSPAAARR